MIIEGRTITTVAEMLEFCLAAIARTGVEPSTIRLHIPYDMLGEPAARECGPVYARSSGALHSPPCRRAATRITLTASRTP